MTNLERLYEINKKLDNELEEVKRNQDVFREVVQNTKKEKWERVFDELVEYSKYSKYIDAGLEWRTSDSIESYGFEVRNMNGKIQIMFITFLKERNISCFNTPKFKKEENPLKTDTYFFEMEKDKPFKTTSHYSNFMEYLEEIIVTWDERKEYIENWLADVMEWKMKQKIEKNIAEQQRLESELRRFS